MSKVHPILEVGAINSFWEKREEIQWDRFHDELSMIREYFTCFGWIFPLFSLSLTVLSQIFSHNFIQHIEKCITFFAIMSQKLTIFYTFLCHLQDVMKILPVLEWKKRKSEYFQREEIKLLVIIFTLVMTKHTNEFSQGNLYALAYHI